MTRKITSLRNGRHHSTSVNSENRLAAEYGIPTAEPPVYNVLVEMLSDAEAEALKNARPWVPSPGLLLRVDALAPNLDKLPKQSRDVARKLLGDAITYGLSDERRVQIDRLIREVTTPLVGRVRQPREATVAMSARESSLPLLAHPSDRLPIKLNSDWQVVEGDLQYILQRRKGTTRSKAKGWVGLSFCRTRDALLRRIREYCGIVDQGALEQVRSLPEWHVDR